MKWWTTTNPSKKTKTSKIQQENEKFTNTIKTKNNQNEI